MRIHFLSCPLKDCPLCHRLNTNAILLDTSCVSYLTLLFGIPWHWELGWVPDPRIASPASLLIDEGLCPLLNKQGGFKTPSLAEYHIKI